MPYFNQVTFVGNLTGDVDLRYLASGAAVAKFSLAVNTPYKDKDGNAKEDTCFIDVEVWEKQAEIVAQYLSKGKTALVSGNLKQNTWEDQDGKKKSKHFVRANAVQFLSPKEASEEPKEKEDVPF